MRHRKSGRKLNRTSSHRTAMFRNMTVSLIRHEQLRTTLTKAKELRRVAEPMITLGKTPSVSNRRLAFARLRDREVVGKLFDDLGVFYKDRPGGYLRILKTVYRTGDTAPMAIVQLVGRTPRAAEAPAEAQPRKEGKPKEPEPKEAAKKAPKTRKKTATKAAAKKTKRATNSN